MRSRTRSGSFGGANESDDDLARLCDRESSETKEEETFKRKMAFYFMNPIEKYTARKQIPWKLLLQFCKVLFVTSQVVVFGNFRHAQANYRGDIGLTFEHFLLQDWDPVWETYAYPPATGTYAIYSKSAFYNHFDYVVNGYNQLSDNFLTPIRVDRVVGFCVDTFSGVTPVNITTQCIEIRELEDFDSKTFLSRNFPIPWDQMQRMMINFTATTKTVRPLQPVQIPLCFQFLVRVFFDNSDHDGQIPVTLEATPTNVNCTDQSDIDDDVTSSASSYVIMTLNYTVILLCTLSFVLCCRALIRAQLLKNEAIEFFKTRFGWTLTCREQLDFLNVWYILICINDVLIIIGSFLKDFIERKDDNGYLWDFCSLCLGCGNFLVWIGMLRYLGFFKTYNVLILTLKGCVPNVLRFVVCASLIYLGSVFCGWVILGPYHLKFKTIMSTSECLFSLINGDDMFATFSSLPNDIGNMIWIFSRVYLYVFISLFIYVILSLFIAIITDTYDVIKEYYNMGFPVRRIHEFYQRANYRPHTEIFGDRNLQQYGNTSVRNMMTRISSSMSLFRNSQPSNA